MLYRAQDCFPIGAAHVREPLAVAYIAGDSFVRVNARLRAALAATWAVDPESVEVGSIRSEAELFAASIQPESAGDRRLVEDGEWSGHPLYHDGDRVFLFLADFDRRRVSIAYDAARRHEQAIAAEIEAKAGITDEERAAAVKLRARAGVVWRGGQVVTRENKELMRIAGLLELSQQLRGRGQVEAANDNEGAARRRLAAVIMGVQA